mmetsp:Transcript_36743/g.84594  ORF Transcript_36743/g.84594 Transcript_36743/m.84594 type:complete len:287 (+) Transcript_36743:49-909(+)
MFDDDVMEDLLREKLDEYPPIFVAFYSGGFYPAEGEKLVEPILQAVKEQGLKDTLILHHPDAYGMEGSGYEPYPAYLDRLVEEIDKDPQRAGRRLLLFGHSRGVCPAYALACRLGQRRVKKIYVTATGGFQLGEKTGWEHISEHFKSGGDDLVVKWLLTNNPGNAILEQAAKSKPQELEAMLADSKWFRDLMTLTKLQYKTAMFPDPTRDLKVTDVPIMSFPLTQDPSADKKSCAAWTKCTTAKVEYVEINTTHMGVLKPQAKKGSSEQKHFPLGIAIGKDIKQFL